MEEAELVERFHLLQQEINLAGEAVDRLRRDHRADLDALRLELEVLRRCLFLMHPELQEHEAKVRSDVIQETDPETS
jgi:hypothetical protein